MRADAAAAAYLRRRAARRPGARAALRRHRRTPARLPALRARADRADRCGVALARGAGPVARPGADLELEPHVGRAFVNAPPRRERLDQKQTTAAQLAETDLAQLILEPLA